ncbi:unnamed protein product [Allacma fusca]|uniref:Cytochrome P450 n=1 Tax=Allacma fusca TaxID=39272 RepID=A0A8J2PBU4_9HEXA|nr:unnamed protein product [Allacma fusca]
MASSLGLTLVWVFALAFLFLLQRRRKTRNFPPGPSWSFPILGHLPMLGNEPYKTMLEWKKTFGPLIGVQVGSYQAVFINDLKSVKEMFNRNEFSGRAQLELFVQSNQGKV